jgi:hypothetical protein
VQCRASHLHQTNETEHVFFGSGFWMCKIQPNEITPQMLETNSAGLSSDDTDEDHEEEEEEDDDDDDDA